ncbi:MAG: DUF1990 family protein [Myxococcota bacterium]
MAFPRRAVAALSAARRPPGEGQVVASIVRVAGLRLVNPCRAVYLEPPLEEAHRVRFAYGTLPGHVEAGEERFTVGLPRRPVASAGRDRRFPRIQTPPAARPARPPFARRMQRRFAAASAEAPRRAVR